MTDTVVAAVAAVEAPVAAVASVPVVPVATVGETVKTEAAAVEASAETEASSLVAHNKSLLVKVGVAALIGVAIVGVILYAKGLVG